MAYELITALITPFKENGAVNFNKIKELIEFQYINGVNGIVILGTTSESSTLSDAEKEAIIEFVVKEVQSRICVIVGVIENSTKEALYKAKRYQELGADKLLVISPFYNKANKIGMISHFKIIAANIDIPIILYNVPSRTGVNIDIDVISELRKEKNIIGIKEASKDINHIIGVSTVCDSNFSLYCGNDELLLTFLSLNAKGVISVLSNLKPRVVNNILKMYEENPYLAFIYFKENFFL